MEACVGAHHLSRKLQMPGHDARLMPAKYVRPYSKGQKNDFRDAEAIAEAVQRPTMKFVATKTADQLDFQALHRFRDRMVSQRTGVFNQIRSKDFAFHDINFQTFWLQKRKSNHLQIITFDLERTAGPYKGANTIHRPDDIAAQLPGIVNSKRAPSGPHTVAHNRPAWASTIERQIE